MRLTHFSKDNGEAFRPVNVGFGYSYILPIIVNMLVIPEGSVLIVENPEAHLFPAAQSRLMEFLVKYSQKRNIQVKDAIVVHSIEELLEELKKYDEENIYIIGGESIYRQMLPYCDVAHVTKIDHAYEADAYFPNLDGMDDWEITDVSDEQTYFDVCYHFVTYQRKKA